MLRIIRLGITLMVFVVIIGGGFVLYSRHSLTAELDATVITVANHYSALTTTNALSLLEHSEITERQLGMLHALSAMAGYLSQAKTTEERVRTIVEYQIQARAFVASLTSEQVTLGTDDHFLSFAHEIGKNGSVRKDIEQYNNLLIRIRGVEESGQASILPMANRYSALPFLRFDGPAPAKVEVRI